MLPDIRLLKSTLLVLSVKEEVDKQNSSKKNKYYLFINFEHNIMLLIANEHNIFSDSINY